MKRLICVLLAIMPSACLLGGCAGLLSRQDRTAAVPPLPEMPVSWFWSWSRQSIHDEKPRPVGGNCVFIAPGLILTARHIYPMGRMEIDGVRTFVTGITDIGGPFGGAENDWVLIRTKVA